VEYEDEGILEHIQELLETLNSTLPLRADGDDIEDDSTHLQNNNNDDAEEEWEDVASSSDEEDNGDGDDDDAMEL
jgi:hypothetical protein